VPASTEPFEYEDLPLTVAAALERAVVKFGTLEALVDGDLRLNWSELLDRVDIAARALIATGINSGDRVAIWAQNTAEWVIAACAIHRCGAVLVPLNTRFKRPEATYILENAGVRLLFTVSEFLGTDYVELLGDRSALPLLEHVILLGGPARAQTTAWADFLSTAKSVPATAAAERAEALTPDDLCDILFTSGTTGLPKGAMLTHGASVRAYWSWSTVVGLTQGDRYLIINPFFHGFGLKSGILASILMGATILPHPVFDVPSVMRRVEEERITMLPGPPTVYMTMLDHPELKNFDLSSLRLSVTGAATVPVEMIHRMRSEMTFKTIVTGYGLTEATGIATMCRHTDDPEIIANTAGRAIPDVEVIVADENRQPVASGEPGEVLIRGYNIMKGFIGNPEATAEAIDEEGWLHTGDIGVMDVAGNLRITDRMKDMFIVGGFNAYPAEIENILLTHPGISQVAVLGIPDSRMGEIGVAFVIAKPEVTMTPNDIVAWSRESMANYKVPRHVIMVEEFPLNASGKVLKYVLRETAIANAS
jgi:acyl-CoA synthetase (AMP-forming)/AMP-acid ligase II